MIAPIPAPNPSPVRMFYVDDSGAPDTGWVLYSCIEVTFSDWKLGLRAWLDLRKDLFARFKIPPSTELHASPFLNGRGEPSLDANFNQSKSNRAAAFIEALRVIGTCPHLRISTFYRHTPARRRAYNRERGEVYEEMVNRIDARLGAAGEHGLIFMDGAGNDPAYYAAHRSLKLSSRHLIEDPLFQHSHRSQWVQMADLAAYSAYQSLIRIPQKRFAWEWYPTYLGPIDLHGGPVQV